MRQDKDPNQLQPHPPSPADGSGNECEEEEADVEHDGEVQLDAEDLDFVVDDPVDNGAGEDDDASEEDDGCDELEGERRRPLDVTRDDAAATLVGHASSVFCVAASPDGHLLASGGEDDRALVWRISADGDRIATTLAGVCGGHGDSVVFAAFNRTGSMLATGDLAGRVQVWETAQFSGGSGDAQGDKQQQPQQMQSGPEAKAVWSGEVAELRWGCWHPQAGSALLIGAGDGSCWLWQVPSGECKVLPSGRGPCETTCGAVLPGDPRCALVAYDSGQVRLLDLKAAAPAAGQQQGLTCESAVLAIDVAPTSGLAACGTESGQVVCFRAASLRQPLSVCNLPQVSASVAATAPALSAASASSSASSAAAGGTSNWAVESVQFCPQQETLLAVGCLAGFAFVFSLAAGGDLRVRVRCDVGEAVVRVLWLPGGSSPPRFVTADVGGRARLWGGLTGEPLRDWRGHRDALLDVCLLPRSAAEAEAPAAAAAAAAGPPLLVTCADKCDCTVKLFRLD